MTININFISIADIRVAEDRQRKEFNPAKLVELAESIRDTQLMHPLVLTADKELIAGERRLKAITALHKKDLPVRFNGTVVPNGMVPYIDAGSLTEYERKELELHENLRRDNLTWQEEAAALSELKALRGEQAEAENKPAPTNKSIAKEVQKNQAEVQQKLVLSGHLSDPDVAKAKSPNEALKVLKRKQDEKDRQERAASVDTKDIIHELVNMDCREYIKTLPDSFLSVVVTDPPYGIDMHKDKSWDGSDHEYDDTEEYAFELIQALVPEWDRTTKDEAHLYIFCDFDKFQWLRAIISSYRIGPDGRAGFLVDPAVALVHLQGVKPSTIMRDTKPVFDVMYFPFIWDKGNIAAYPRPDHWPRKSYECVLYAIKGDMKHAKLDLAVIQGIPQIQNQDHPAGKPMELYRYLLARSAQAGDSAGDFFVGQGNFFKACHSLKLIGYGSELSEKYHAMAKISLGECK